MFDLCTCYDDRLAVYFMVCLAMWQESPEDIARSPDHVPEHGRVPKRRSIIVLYVRANLPVCGEYAEIGYPAVDESNTQRRKSGQEQFVAVGTDVNAVGD